MVCVVALPPWLATIGASTASATIFCKLVLEQAEHRGREERGREVDQQPVEAALGDGPDRVGQLFVAVTPPSALMSSSASSSITSTMSSKVMHADQAVVVVDHRRRDQVVALELRAPPPPGRRSRAPRGAPASISSDDRHRPLGAQQPVERHRAEEFAGRIDDVDFEEALRQVRRSRACSRSSARRSRTAAPR